MSSALCSLCTESHCETLNIRGLKFSSFSVLNLSGKEIFADF